MDYQNAYQWAEDQRHEALEAIKRLKLRLLAAEELAVALRKIAFDYHEDNPERHINPVQCWEVADEALEKWERVK